MKDLFRKHYFCVKQGLKYLVIYHRITGITYLGWNFGQTKACWKKVVCLLWQACLFILAIYFTFNELKILFNVDKVKAKLAASPKSIMVFLMMQLGNIGYILTVMYCFFLLLLKGNKMLEFLQHLEFKPELKTERWIGIKTLIIQIGVTFTIEIFFATFLHLLMDGHCFSNLAQIGYMLMSTLILNIKMSLIAVMIYKSYSIEAELKHITKNFTSLSQFTSIFDQILQIQRTMKKFDKFINQFIVMSFTFNSISAITYINLLYFETWRKLNFSLGGIAECLSPIFIICYFSNKTTDNYNKFLDKFEELELKNTKSVYYDKIAIDHSIVNRLYTIRKSLCFTAFNLYKINTSSFVSVMSLIITFSAILIQTNDQIINIVD